MVYILQGGAWWCEVEVPNYFIDLRLSLPPHSAFEGHLRGSVISNFHDVAGFYMLVGGFSEGIGLQLPQILTQ